MEKTVEKEIKAIERIHEFYCDECGEKIYESVESSNGWFMEPDKNKFVLSFSMNNECSSYCKMDFVSIERRLRTMLCDNCAARLKEKFERCLSDFGLA